MIRKLGIAFAVLLMTAPAIAHRLDQYLEATLLTVEKDHLDFSLRLVPGVAVSSTIIANIDSNHDGVISEQEQHNYTEQVFRDLSVTVDGRPVALQLLSEKFPSIEEVQEGIGQIQIDFRANLPAGGRNRRVMIENHHQSPISAYLVNCLKPRDPDIQVIAQRRNEDQSRYELDFAQGGLGSGTSLQGISVGFGSLFRLGVRHIAEGTDHLLFLVVLLVPAPLIVVNRSWAGYALVRDSLPRILKVVTAFTVGHSLTLALAALGVVRVPSRPIELVIAVSILVSAAHAIRPLFPGREAVIAAFFGLIHGLAFASTLGQLGLDRWQRVASILGFNLGIESMQLIVVAATMPSLLLLSRTRAYPLFRISGALFAGFASLGWIAERAMDIHLSVDMVVNAVAHRAVGIALLLFLSSVGCWLTEGRSAGSTYAPSTPLEPVR